MKKLLAIAVALTAFVAVAAAQPRALGVRFGSPSFLPGFGAELSYQHGLGTTNFIEFDLGWSTAGINGTASWDYVIAEFGGGFDFYAGPGANVYIGDGFTSIGVCGQVGIEYTFGSVPLQLSLDVRPNVVSINDGVKLLDGIYPGLGIRYAF